MFKTMPKYEPRMKSGEHYEKNLLGTVDFDDPDYKRDLEKIKKPARLNSGLNYYINFKDALGLVRKYQPKKEKSKERVGLDNPQKRFLDDLRWEIVEGLGLKEEGVDKLRVYTSDGSPLDYLHGADFVIDWDGKIMTADISLKREKKAQSKKADIMILKEIPSPLDKEQEKEYWARVEAVGRQVASKFIKDEYHGDYPLNQKEEQKVAA